MERVKRAVNDVAFFHANRFLFLLSAVLDVIVRTAKALFS
jgi:hypothetical protein